MEAHERAGDGPKKLIAAAVRCVYDADAPPPAELRLAWMCGDHHLPGPGGVFDQDFMTMRRMRTLDNIYRTVDRFRNLQGAQIHTLTKSERRILRMLREEGLIGAG